MFRTKYQLKKTATMRQSRRVSAPENSVKGTRKGLMSSKMSVRPTRANRSQRAGEILGKPPGRISA